MIGPDHEGPRPSTGAGFTDSVSFAFAEAEEDLYGLARIGVAPDERRASGLAVLFAGSEPAAALAVGGVDVPEPGWDDVRVSGLRAQIIQPLESWRLELEADRGGLELDFSAVCAPLELGPATDAARASGVEGYEQLCQVEGEVRVDGRSRRLACLGQRGHGWGPAPWERIDLARTVSAWLDGPRWLTLSAVRPAGADAPDREATTAFLVEPGDDDPAVLAIAEPRLSTTYDADGRQRRAGLELWVSEEDDLPRRAAGEVACGTSLDLGRLRLQCAFFRWRMEGRTGVGRYDVLARA